MISNSSDHVHKFSNDFRTLPISEGFLKNSSKTVLNRFPSFRNFRTFLRFPKNFRKFSKILLRGQPFDLWEGIFFMPHSLQEFIFDTKHRQDFFLNCNIFPFGIGFRIFFSFISLCCRIFFYENLACRECFFFKKAHPSPPPQRSNGWPLKSSWKNCFEALWSFRKFPKIIQTWDKVVMKCFLVSYQRQGTCHLTRHLTRHLRMLTCVAYSIPVSLHNLHILVFCMFFCGGLSDSLGRSVHFAICCCTPRPRRLFKARLVLIIYMVPNPRTKIGGGGGERERRKR